MRLHTFIARNCFGFGPADPIDLSYTGNLIYVLGRNSAGKTALLTAIESLGSPQSPAALSPRFRNFDPTLDEPAVIGEFDGFQLDDESSYLVHGVSFAVLRRHLTEELGKVNGNNPAVINNETYIKIQAALIADIEGQFEGLFKSANASGRIWVSRDESGDYTFGTDQAFSGAIYRRNAITAAIDQSFSASGGGFSSGQRVLPTGGGGWQGVTLLTARQIENLLWKQFPTIVRFDDRGTLSANLPDTITAADLSDDSPLLNAFVDVLDKTTVQSVLNTQNQKT